MALDINKIRQDFPALHQQIYKKQLVYLDNAATNQKPQVVIDALTKYYSQQNSNIHRGVHYLSQKATDLYEETRLFVQKFINAANSHEIIFTRGTTESINLVASSFGKTFVNENDEIILSALEHHSNIVPWQLMAEERKAKIKVIPMDDNGELILSSLENLITDKTKIIAVTQVSNALGIVNDIEYIIKTAHSKNIPVLIDGAQAVSHFNIDVQKLDCDFYCFSGHKLYGPTGVGVLYGKEKWLEKMVPYHGGGEMIKHVSFEKTTYNELPFKFEAGTPNIADGIAFKAALEYVNHVGLENIKKHEDDLMQYATKRLLEIHNLKIYGNSAHKSGSISFLIGNIHPFDAGTILDKMGIAVRTGHHCTQPIMDRFKIPGTVRASFAMYNTTEEIDILINGILKVKQMFE